MAKNQTVKTYKQKSICYICADANFFISHRLCIAKAAINAGWKVHLIAPKSKSTSTLNELGILIHNVEVSRTSLNPIQNIKVLISIFKILKKNEPEVIHNIALKPILLGSFAAIFAGSEKIINALSGMGFVFTDESLKSKSTRIIICNLFRVIFKNERVAAVVQNNDDEKLAERLFKARRVIKIPGCVDTDFFRPTDEPKAPPIRLLFCARLLATKGLRELIEAFQIAKKKIKDLELLIVGDYDLINPAAIHPTEIDEWCKITGIKYHGKVEDVRAVIKSCHITVLPTYREGMPKSLLESAAMNRAIITCDVPGCREMLINKKSALLVPAKNVDELASTIYRLAEDKNLRVILAKNALADVEKFYAQKTVMKQFLDLYEG